MNSSYPEFNGSSPSPPTTEGFNLSGLTTALSLLPAPGPSDPHDPGVTIMVVLGLAVLLAGVAAFLAVCRSSEGGCDSDGSVFCGPRGGSGLGASGRGGAATSEPQLKVWKRLGSYRRSYNTSFRRPPQRRAHGAQSPGGAPGGPGGPARSPAAGQTLRTEGCGVEPHAALPCLYDYVTEI